MRMQNTWSRSALSIGALVAVIGLVGCGSTAAAPEAGSDKGTEAAAEAPKLGFVNINTDQFGTCLQKGIEETAKAEGVEVMVANSTLDPAKELSNVEDMITRGADAIILQTVNVDALAGGITKAQEANVPLYLTAVLPNNEEDMAKIFGATVVDLAHIGELAAGWIAEDSGGKDVNVAAIAGYPGGATDIMMGGLEKALPTNAKFVGAQPGLYNRGKAQETAENILQANADLDYLFVQNEDMAFGALNALKDAGKTDVTIVTSGGTEEGLKAIEAGDFGATIADPAYNLGEFSVTGTLALLEDPSAEKMTQSPSTLITKDNLDEAPAYCG